MICIFLMVVYQNVSNQSDDSCLVNQLLQFIHIVRSSPCGVAVHCKAGLGRTGTMICAYLMYEYGMSCEEAIGYCRLCRPGSVVGCQQHFLKVMNVMLID